MSQYGEHHAVLKHFAGRKGKFLDIGAYDGITFSNTYALYCAGWKGVLVEPAPDPFRRLEMVYRQDSGCELVNAAICQAAGLRKFYDCQGDFPSTFVGDRKEHFSKNPFREITVNATTWADLLALYPGPYDFLNIDVEGLNWEALLDCPILREVEMICVEADPEEKVPEMESWLADTHANVCRIGGNILACR